MLLRQPAIPAILLFIFLTLFTGARKSDDHNIDITFLQLNDVYEISPLDEGKISGLARVATLKKELQTENKNTYMVLAGDFLSPSAIGTLYDSSEKRKIAGMQMLEALNTAKLDLTVPGNHEFDISSKELSAAMDSSAFDWISSNVKYNRTGEVNRLMKKGEQIPAEKILTFQDEDGTTIKIGVIGLTIETLGNNRYEAYENYYDAAGKAIARLEGNCDFIIALTHLELVMDKELAKRFPQLKLIIGGHEHINSYDKVGNTIIAKADANAKTAYIHRLHYNSEAKDLSIQSRLMVINNAIEEDTATRNVVDAWNQKAYDILVKQNFEPCEILDSVAVPLDGTEASVRTSQTNLGKLICQSLIKTIKTPVDCSMFNSGSIRIDDMLKGYITQYDIFRVLPYENRIVVKILPGKVINDLLKTNDDRQRDGSYLQYDGITKKDSSWYIRGIRLANSSVKFKVATNYYLGMGKQAKLNFLGDKKYPVDSLPKLAIKDNDMRKALIYHIKQNRVHKIYPKNGSKLPCY